jgi:hypothetical protein
MTRPATELCGRSGGLHNPPPALSARVTLMDDAAHW